VTTACFIHSDRYVAAAKLWDLSQIYTSQEIGIKQLTSSSVDNKIQSSSFHIKESYFESNVESRHEIIKICCL